MNHLLNSIVFVGLLFGAVQADYGHIQIEVISASLEKFADAYVIIFTHNTTHSNPFPIKNRAEGYYNKSPAAPRAMNPVWNWICDGADYYILSDQGQITIEVYDGWHEAWNVDGKFLASTTITIKELLANNNSRHEIVLLLTNSDSKNHGALKTLIAWTPNPPKTFAV